jgi:hypothetical protein
MTAGATTITVTSADGTSQAIPFFTRTSGNIYFVSTSGADANDGASIATAWRNPSKVRAMLQAGDVAYFKSGIYNAVDNWTAVIDFWSTNHGNGTLNNSIALTSYPGEVAQIGDSSNIYVMRHHGTNPDILNYWTFSKLIMQANSNIVNWGLDGPGSDESVRFVGNSGHTTSGGKTSFAFDGQALSNNLKLYGNYWCDTGVNTRGEIAPQKGYAIYLQGYGQQQNIDIGWNELSYNSQGRGLQIYGHLGTDHITNVYVHDNDMSHNAFTGAVLGGGDPMSFGPYNFVGDIYVWNNIFSDNGLDHTGGNWAGLLVGGEDSSVGSYGGNYQIYNNIFVNNPGGNYVFGGHPDSVIIKNNLTIAATNFCSDYDGFPNNLIPVMTNNAYWGGASNIPSFEISPITADPKIVDLAGGDFTFLAGSSLIDAGEVIPLFNTDYFGVSRSDGAYDIGAFEHVASTPPIDTTPPEAPSGVSVN